MEYNNYGEFETAVSSCWTLTSDSLTIGRRSVSLGDNVDLNLSDEIKEKLFSDFMLKISRVPIIEYKCHNCGMTLQLKEDQHIFICPYCESTYAVGTSMINS